ncbi:DNA phosphorothioation-dependent restriction protein DptH [Limnobaculum parvum]|uniref:DNA phosphorothioation-dependent restriction protein DptH n=1 Tax=Limnobaculum parvum TaxID=2172103 RepID=A0A2Y9TXC8_9GAMM|nr:DNA phosphorothioation-dependent restriction protein DptH [Limnobaculum parvum]AWH88211.1 DNA phosphorothioation-dependent restriction protein DptH [Limnobaculum parvum]
MSVKLYETYLAQTFIEWVSRDIQAGERYDFKSPDANNALKLYKAFVELSGENSIMLAEQNFHYILCNDIRLIPVLHGDSEPAFTENYISHLRDQFSNSDESFKDVALLIIHNSMLDTLLNSAKDVAASGAIWHPETFSCKLKELIMPGRKDYALSCCLLEDQLAITLDEGATVFSFAPLYPLLDDGNLDFTELELFKDDALLDFDKEQLRNRLNENRKLYSSITESVERYSDQLENVLSEFSPKFIQQHFVENDDWRSLDFSVYREEIKTNNEQKLVLDDISIIDGILWQRAKSSTKAGQRDFSLLIQVPQGQQQAELSFTFIGNDLQDKQVRIAHNNKLKKQRLWQISRAGGKYSRMKVAVPFDGHPCFFSLELVDRGNRAEEYKFRLLIVQKGSFWLEDIKHCYRIEPGNGRLTLQLEENKLRIAQSGDEICTLDENINDIDCSQYAQLDFDTLANESELIEFTLLSGEDRLRFNIEGLSAEEVLTLPLLFDQNRISKLFREDGHAEYNRTKQRIILDNTEHRIVGVRLQLLELEATMVEQQLLYVGKNHHSFTLNDIQTDHPNLYHAYQELFAYYQRYNSLPSLVSWSESYCLLINKVLVAYEQVLLNIAPYQVLSEQDKSLLRLGTYYHEDPDFFEHRERLSPLHPLILAYHLQLVEAIRAEFKQHSSTSFAELPDITLDRLIASGLMPFVYHSEHEYAQLQPVAENRFWIDIVPQRGMSHDYVKRLVKDKLNEFTDAYARLFYGAGNSALIINAINQGKAKELFIGLVDYFKQEKENATPIHVNCYDEHLIQNTFDDFAESGSYEQLKDNLGLNSGAWRTDADMLIDLMRSRLTFSKFTTPPENEKLAYAHLAFFSNIAPVDCRSINIDKAPSGVLCHGLIAGEGSETQSDAYFTAFGLRQVNTEPYSTLRLAKLLGTLWQPARQSNSQYQGQSLGLAVSANFKELLTRSYDSSLWTTIIDPKVTLDFFTNQKGVVLIHYSDQYTSCAGYDAVTVTKQVSLFKQLLQMENTEKQESKIDGEQLLSEFNAFNGEWLLRMLRSNDKERKEKHGIIGAYKFTQAMLRHSDICWIPLSVAEMIRVSGNVGLRMKESEFSRQLHGYRKGAISDDVLFVGFKDGKLFLLPLEVKTGVRPDYKYAGQQARELKRYLQQDILGKTTLASQLYRALFIRQILMQVEKLQIYGVLNSSALEPFLANREWWLTGEYQLGELPDYINGIVLAHVSNGSCFEPSWKETEDRILQIELPYTLLSSLIAARTNTQWEVLMERYHVPEKYQLKPNSEMSVFEAKLDELLAVLEIEPISESVQVNIPVDKSESPQPTVISDEPLQVLFGHESLHQTPLYWEPTNTAKFMNTNTGIIGTMGTGKTQFTKSVVTQLIRSQPNNVAGAPIGLLIFDYKSDYIDEAFIAATGAKKYRLSLLPYNPLSLFGDMPMLPRHTAMGFAETMGRAYNLGVKQRMKLITLVMECYEAAGISAKDSSTWGLTAPTIEDIWQRYITQDKVEEDSLYAALYNLADFQIFETNPENMVSLYDLLTGVTVIELSGYSEEIQNLVVALTLDLFYAQMQKRGKPIIQGDYRQMTKMILVDEADNFMRQDFPSLRKILKEGREYGVGVILSTQEITHFKTGDNNYASYILTWVIHRVSEIKNTDIKAVFNVDDKNEQESLMGQVRQLDKHFSLYIDGDKKVKKMRDKAFWEL